MCAVEDISVSTVTAASSYAKNAGEVSSINKNGDNDSTAHLVTSQEAARKDESEEAGTIKAVSQNTAYRDELLLTNLEEIKITEGTSRCIRFCQTLMNRA